MNYLSRVSALCAGLLFGAGLIISGMADPAKVIGFLNLAGPWDPSLAFVMGGALAVTIPAFALAQRRPATLLGESWPVADKTRIDGRLILGSVLFGLGWALAGICPGPALVGLGAGYSPALVFAFGLVPGFLLASRIGKE